MIRPFRTDADIKSLSDQTIKSIATNIQEKGCAVFYNQSLSSEEYIQTMSMFGEMEKPDLFMNPKEFPEIFLVTGERDDKGNKITSIEKDKDGEIRQSLEMIYKFDKTGNWIEQLTRRNGVNHNLLKRDITYQK